ncbi:hypothetical protein GCM10023238_25440 [Streptomyces heliomycini]
MTVLVSSDTDIYISPGFVRRLLADGCNRRDRGFIPGRARVFLASLLMLAHAVRSGNRLRWGLVGEGPAPIGIHVTRTLWPSSK